MNSLVHQQFNAFRGIHSILKDFVRFSCYCKLEKKWTKWEDLIKLSINQSQNPNSHREAWLLISFFLKRIGPLV